MIMMMMSTTATTTVTVPFTSRDDNDGKRVPALTAYAHSADPLTSTKQLTLEKHD